MTTSIQHEANELVDACHRLAREILHDYSEDCADSGCTNPPPTDDQERLVSWLHITSLLINGSGLCDYPIIEPPVFQQGYLSTHGWRPPT